MTSRTLRLSSNRLVHYLDSGSGEPVLLVHGVGMQALAWHPQIEFLSNNYRVIAVDMPGHGASEGLAGEVGLQDYVRWMAECIERLDVGPVSLAGHSMGALVAVGTAIERPELVTRVAAVNGVHRRSPEARAAVLRRAHQLQTGGLDVQAPLSRWFDPTDDPVVVDRVRGWLESVDLAGYAAAYRAFALGDEVYADRWPEIACPALVLTGAQDPNSTAEMAVRMASLGQQAYAVVIDGHKHMVNLTAPDAVNQALSDWMQITALAPSEESLGAST
ncbi:alpha/beta hydrolase [Lampropedia cohaerens]|uniref:Alpha/beta hydrolase n=1 Tax=Lampropedia cohaerens TaxID=1610491 RepID=A0A0U1Q000_9BURK|nr:alpha/beta hydrolase [Lampropedia cohaerens]KKW68051.1 alpha/beta hydrolase [Lampropedia cohaerens]